MRTNRRGALLASVLALFPARAFAASDAASLQFTVPAPDPAQAGDIVSLQALAVNTGGTTWSAGSYYWVGEVYDLDEHLIARTDQISPPVAVPPGAIADISLPFHIPDTMFGRRLYRVFLVKDTKNLLESDYKGFQIVEKPIPPPPEVVTYHMEGNLTTSFKDSSQQGWKDATGATTFNTSGKVSDSSYLLNMYVLHQPGNVFDITMITGNLYAPWGTIFGGDINPNLGPLGVSGQGFRGVMLEQKKGMWDWDVLGGRTITSEAGTATTDGRYARSLYAGKLGFAPVTSVKLNANYFVSSDEAGSLSKDPTSNNFAGPTLVPQKNQGYGLDGWWEPFSKIKLVGAYQKNQYWADTGGSSVNDASERAEFDIERKTVRLKIYAQRAGANFVAFDNPSVAGDRMTYDAQLGIFPAAWYNFSLGGDQYKTNVAHSAEETTTTQRIVNMTNAFTFKSGTTANLTGSLNTALGTPASVLDNQTTTVGVNVGQAIGKNHVGLNVQDSEFKDKDGLAHNLDTLTEGFTGNWKLPRNWGLTVGLTETDTKDKTDGSHRTSSSFGPSLSVPLAQKWTGQFWGTYTATKNTSATLPADNAVVALNTEYTWARSKQFNVTFGIGETSSRDRVQAGNTYNALTASTRLSYTF
ncbi:MAG: hypothetical protein ACHQ49_08230 [Elusimicrobiota bacterium]